MYNFTEEEIVLFHNKVSNNVKKIRKLKNFTQLDLSIELGFKNSSFISHAENPNLITHYYSLDHLYKISKILDINMCELIK